MIDHLLHLKKRCRYPATWIHITLISLTTAINLKRNYSSYYDPT